jgi:hypothetical protein
MTFNFSVGYILEQMKLPIVMILGIAIILLLISLSLRKLYKDEDTPRLYSKSIKNLNKENK